MRTLAEVLAADACSGCGACVLAGAAQGMALDDRGDLRPLVSPGALDPDVSGYCPGVRVVRPPAQPGTSRDPFLGPILGIWSAHAVDEALRRSGSSGGALSALARTALAEGMVEGVTMAGGVEGSTRTAAVEVRDADRVGDFAASRYAPVSTLAALPRDADRAIGLVARPCEAAAVTALSPQAADRPLVLAFFCAGVPRQRATDDLVQRLGMAPGEVSRLRYRGNGWPGSFEVEARDGRTASLPYSRSWGDHLGRDLQDRCKTCVDGVGESADVAAGDLWHSDDRGYPDFSEAPGRSVLIARTARGMNLVSRAVARGELVISPTTVAEVLNAQPLQVARRRHLWARLMGRRMAGYRTSRYPGYRLAQLSLASPRESIRQARGAFRRARQVRRDQD